jgi:asparagine synthase (glutamine-hydrolysing)
MCGFAGLLTGTVAAGRDGELPRIAAAMGLALRHRGPDAGDEWHVAGEPVALAHRRLSILDLSPAGAQPMLSHCGRYVLAYNGEIFNFPAVRAAVERARGPVPWRGHSDTEILLEAIATLGLERAVSLCNGMFALAVWDRRERALSLARDRLGKKPLYYGLLGGDFAFGSEVAALRAHPGWRFEPDLAALASYLRTGYVPEPLTGFAGLRKLPSGSTLLLRPADVATGRFPSPRPFWRADELVSEREPSDPGGLEAVIADAVADRLVADVPVGAFLSGGVDSTIVTALMKRLAGSVRTFTIGFDDSPTSESRHAAAVARHLGTDHEELVLTPEQAADLVPRVASAYDEPFADSSSIPTWLVSGLAARHVKVVLAGDGADEMFGGYTRYAANARLWNWRSRIPATLRVAAGAVAAGALATPAAGRYASIAASLVAPDGREFYRRRTSFFLDPVRLLPGVVEPAAARLVDAPSPAAIERQMMYMDVLTYLPDDILAKVDRASMAHGLEVRSPFLDDRVVEFAWGLPDAAVTGANGGKRLLKDLLYRLVPRELVDRPKTGFGFPIERWLRGRMRPWAEDTLFGSAALDAAGCDRDAVRSVWDGLLAGRMRLAGGVWNLLMLAAWLQRNAEAPRGD